MAILLPFRALRPTPQDASRIAAVPYDVVSTDEARALADGNPLSFLRVSRAELELAPGADAYSAAVYERAAKNFAALRARALVVEDQPSLYFYRLRMGTHVQLGLAGCFSLDDYDRNVIRKHERTRRDKEDDRTRHMLALGAQTGPVFLTYGSVAAVDGVARDVTARDPLFDFTAPDGVTHTIWRADREACTRLVELFARIPALYIADGHHRAASAARARDTRRSERSMPDATGDGAEANTMLGVAFPSDQVQILAYNRIVRDLGDLSAERFARAVAERFSVTAGPPAPSKKGDVAMYFQGAWQTLRPRARVDGTNGIGALDVSVLQHELLEPILGIGDVRTDKRIDFVGGARGTTELQRLVDSGGASVAFSLFPVSVDDLMAVSDAGGIMPPKSTWFEPKLRDGLLTHLI